MSVQESPIQLTPLLGLSRKGLYKTLKFIDIDPPIQNEIRDVDEVQDFFKTFPFIPYSGISKESSHRLQEVLMDMRHLSTTHGACIQSIIDFAFSGQIDLTYNIDSDFIEDKVDEITAPEKLAFKEYLKTFKILNAKGWKDLLKKLSISYDCTGDMWLELIIATSAGVVQPFIKFLLPSNVLYKTPGSGFEQRYVCVSSVWNDMYLKKHPPFELAENMWQTYDDGTIRMIIHEKCGIGNWYGRPPAFDAFIDMWNEWRLKEYISKQIHRGWVANFILEMEASAGARIIDNAAAKSQGYKNADDQWQQSFGNIGVDPGTGIIIERAHGSRPMAVHEIPPLRSETFFKELNSEFRANIIMAHDWSGKLMAIESASGFTTSMFKDIFDIKSVTKILDRQNVCAAVVNKAIDKISEVISPEMMNYNIMPTSAIQTMLNELNEDDNKN